MSASTKIISVSSSLIPAQIDTVLDVRTRCKSEDDFKNIENPYLGMLIYTIDDNNLWIVTELGAKVIGVINYENAQIAKAVKLSEFLKFDLTQDDALVDYRKLSNKPKFVSGEGINLNCTYAGSLLVAGATDENCNGIYAPMDYYATGTDRVWAKEGRFIHHSNTAWYIDSDIDTTSFYYSAEGDKDPWTLEFSAALAELGNPPTVTLIDISKDNDHYDVQVDLKKVALKSDIETYTAGSGIEITDDNIISCTVEGGGVKYTAGANITISDTNEISATDTKYTAGSNITISKTNEISSTDTKYTAGAGISISNDNVISCSISQGESIRYDAGTGLVLKGTTFSIDTEMIATQTYVDTQVGPVQDVLDELNASLSAICSEVSNG